MTQMIENLYMVCVCCMKIQNLIILEKKYKKWGGGVSWQITRKSYSIVTSVLNCSFFVKTIIASNWALEYVKYQV